jgi:hypothetical protein
MAGEHVERFYVLFFAGLGLLLAGLVNALWRSQSDRVRVLFAVLACGGLLGALWAWEPSPRLVGRAAALVAVVTVPCLVVRSAWVAAAAARVAGLFRRPAVCWGLIGAAGLCGVIGSVAGYEADETRIADEYTRDMELLAARPPLGVADGVRATTDRGTEVTLKWPTETRPTGEVLSVEHDFLSRFHHRDAVICRSAADEGTNCHGWVFAGGRFWVGGSQVDVILRENGYAEVSDPRPGDLVVYRVGGDEVAHSAVVRYVTPGMPVLVEGKWGWMGVYLHPVERSAYGTDYLYYRSPRVGHVLAGIGDHHPATPPAE